MKLIGTTSSPFTRKVRIVALERNLPLQFVIDNPLTAGTAVPSLNPLGKVPVLALDDGTALIESSLIAEYLDATAGPPRFIPSEPAERMAVRRWEALANGVMDAAVLLRLESLRPQNERSASWIERQQGKVERGLAFMNRDLGQREYCVGNSLTLADVALGCCMGYLEFRFAAAEWRAHHAEVTRAARKLEERPSFRATPMA